MQYRQSRARRFQPLFFAVIGAAVCALAFFGWNLYNSRSADNRTADSVANESDQPDKPAAGGNDTFIEWGFNGSTWSPLSSAPACEEPVTIGAPTDLSKATSVLYPGQVRGGEFKPHGGLGFDNASTNQLQVYALMDGFVYQGARYIEGGAVQYMFDLMNPCGLRYRYDHLATLTDSFMKYANELPEPKPDESRTTRFSKPYFVNKGELIATAVGTSRPLNVGFDVGVYDLRTQNAASKTAVYQTDQKRIEDKEQSFYAVCWFDLLPENEKAVVKGLPPRGGAKENNSDYCDVN